MIDHGLHPGPRVDGRRTPRCCNLGGHLSARSCPSSEPGDARDALVVRRGEVRGGADVDYAGPHPDLAGRAAGRAPCGWRRQSTGRAIHARVRSDSAEAARGDGWMDGALREWSTFAAVGWTMGLLIVGAVGVRRWRDTVRLRDASSPANGAAAGSCGRTRRPSSSEARARGPHLAWRRYTPRHRAATPGGAAASRIVSKR